MTRELCTATGDISCELGCTVLHFLWNASCHSLPVACPIEFLVFYDYRTVGNVELLPSEPRYNTIKSIGAGLQYALERNVAINLDYGWQLA